MSICLPDIRVIRYDGASLRNFSSSSQPSIDVSYEQLKRLLLSDSSVVIDVREPWELREYGNIPGSINVPCKSVHGLIRVYCLFKDTLYKLLYCTLFSAVGQVNGALQLTPDEFKEKYGGVMPSQSQTIVFSCLAGVRSMNALETAVSLGYTK